MIQETSNIVWSVIEVGWHILNNVPPSTKHMLFKDWVSMNEVFDIIYPRYFNISACLDSMVPKASVALHSDAFVVTTIRRSPTLGTLGLASRVHP